MSIKFLLLGGGVVWGGGVPILFLCYAAPIGAFFCPEIRAFTGRDFFNPFQSP